MSRETMFDRRIIARNIKHGRTSRKEFEQYLTSLPDVSSKAAPLVAGPSPAALGDDNVDDDLDDDEDEALEEGDGV